MSPETAPGRPVLSFLAALGPVVGGALLGIAFWKPQFGPIAWVALIPFGVVMCTRRYRIEAYFGTFVGGVVFHSLALEFLRTDSMGLLGTTWVVQSYALSPFLLLSLFLGRALVLQARWPVTIALPASWVAMEIIRRHGIGAMLAFGFPFLQLGTTQVECLPLIQVADLVGIAGISWLVAAVNGALADLVTAWGRRRPLRSLAFSLPVATVPLFAAFLYGDWRLATTPGQPGPRVVVLPGSFLERPAEEAVAHIVARTGIRGGDDSPQGEASYRQDLDLIVLPEHGYHFPYIIKLAADPDGSPASSETTAEVERLWRLSRTLRAPVAFGACRNAVENGNYQAFNSMLYFTEKRGYSGSYDKIQIVPVYEFQPPLGRILAFFTGRPILHPRTLGNRSYDRGSRYPLFRLDRPRRRETYVFAASICSDGYFPGIFRPYFEPRPDQPRPDFLVNIANEMMTLGTRRAALTDLRFRAIEFRRSVVRSCWDGYSALIDSCSRVVAVEEGPESDKVPLIVDVPLDTRSTLYAAIGDVPSVSLTAGVVVIVLYTMIRRWLPVPPRVVDRLSSNRNLGIQPDAVPSSS